MKQAKDIYPEYDGGYQLYDYQPIINSFGCVAVQENDNDYRGDTYVLYHDKQTGKVGYLIFGWGSCSGCDALQACDSFSDLQDLIGSLEKQVKWFSSIVDAKAHFDKYDWKGNVYAYSRDEFQSWLKQSKQYLLKN